MRLKCLVGPSRIAAIHLDIGKKSFISVGYEQIAGFLKLTA